MLPEQKSLPPFIELTTDGFILKAKINPRSSQEDIIVTDQEVKIKVNPPPVGGAANRQVVEFLSRLLGITKSNITILVGSKSHYKIINFITENPQNAIRILLSCRIDKTH